MEQFTVPQFIDVEDKVVGPLSVRQFLILLGAFGLCFLFYKVFVFIYFVIGSVISVVLGGAFAFVKVSGVPLHYFLINFITAFRYPSVRVWARDMTHDFDEAPEVSIYHPDKAPERSFSSSHLNQLALIVDTRGYYGGEQDDIDIIASDNSNHNHN